MTETRHSSRIPLLIFVPVLVVVIVWLLPGSHYRYREQREGGFALPADTKVVAVRIQTGNVRVVVGRPGHVAFRARTLRAAQDEEALQVLRAQDLTLGRTWDQGKGEFLLSTPPLPAGLEVDHASPTKDGGQKVRKGLRGMREVHVRLEVPPRMPVRIDCDLGNVTIEYLSAPVTVHTDGGTVHLKVVTGDANVRVGRGDVVVDQHRGALDILTRSGRVLVLLSEVPAPARLRTLAGDVKCTVPPDAAFDLDARSLAGGGIVSDFALPRVSLGKEGQQMHGEVRGGGPLLHVESAQGTVSVLVQR